jgi:hypothetical protein
MSEDAVSRATGIYDLLAQWRRKLASESTNTPLRVIEMLAANPSSPPRAWLIIKTCFHYGAARD